MTATPASPDATQVRIERVLEAPVEEVFAAWTDPESMAVWMSPTGRAEVEADVREGGKFGVVMIGGDMRIEHTGEYMAVEPPRRLSFTWCSPYTGGASLVTLTLTPAGDATHLLLVHERLPEAAVESHAGGWGSMLDNLATALHTG